MTVQEIDTTTTRTAAIETSILEAARSELTKSDRCDRCNAEAYVRLTNASGSSLLFCGHHFNAYPNLAAQALHIHSEMDKLFNK